MPHSLFHSDSSPSFSLPAGMDMNQAAIMNPMMQPVPILGQQSFSTPRSNFRPVTEADLVGTEGMSASQIVDMLNQPDYETPALPAAASKVLDFAQTTLDFLTNNFGETPSSQEETVFRRRPRTGEPKNVVLDFLTSTDFSRPTFRNIPDVDNFEDFEFIGPQMEQPISPFLQSPDTPSGLGGPLLRGFNMVNEAARGPNAPMGRDATRARIAELFGLDAPATLNQAMLNDLDAVMGTDAQGRLRSFESPAALQQNLANAQSAFDLASLDRLARLEQRDLRPGETLQERDTRIADSRTEGADRGGEMSFEEARKFVPKGAREKTKDYNERVRAFQAQQNSYISQLKEQYEQYRVQGQVLNNQRIQAYIAQYQQTEPEKYREILQVAQQMLRDEILEDEVQVAMYVIDQMGGESTDIFDPVVEFMRGGNDGESGESGVKSFDTEEEAMASGVKGEVIINGRRAIIE
tara:strand:+ start:32 stop:1426 length:1395 start_codon:yes stop_codon:yes gene_type:complete